MANYKQKYKVGENFGRSLIIGEGRCETGKRTLALRCGCGAHFERLTQNLVSRADVCRACSHEERLVRALAKRLADGNGVCELCGDLDHRVNGEQCAGCDRVYQELPELHAFGDMQSSAAMALSL